MRQTQSRTSSGAVAIPRRASGSSTAISTAAQRQRLRRLRSTVPMVFGVPNAIPNFMTVQVLGLRVLRDKFPEMVDAMEPGGSGDPYAGLDAEQQKVLREITRLGFPLRGWWQYATLSGGAFAATAGGVRAFDGSYIDDFWTKPGYEGSDPSVRAARIQQDATVDRVVGSPPKSVSLSPTPPAG